MRLNLSTPGVQVVLLGIGIGVGLGLASMLRQPSAAQEPAKDRVAEIKAGSATSAGPMMADSAPAYDPNWEKPYPQYQPVGKVLKQYPRLKPGEPVPQELYRYGGRGHTSFASVDDVENFDEFHRRSAELKPRIMAERRQYMERRYDLSGKTTTEATMTRGKPIPVGPVVRLPQGVKSWE